MTLPEVTKLYRKALSYDFSAFRQELDHLIQRNAENTADLYSMKAQIKLLTGDETALADLRRMDALEQKPRLPLLLSQWKPNSPNSFFVFHGAPGSVQSFLEILSPCGELLRAGYGDTGYGTVMQIKAEILYFMGMPEDAAQLSEKLFHRTESYDLYHVLTGYTLFRCYLAMGKIHAAESVILEIIRCAKKSDNSHCVEMYHTIREWVNLTTGWSGDSPRYQQTTTGDLLPVLDDRITAIRKGISELSSTEEPFVNLARQTFGNSYAMRELYMDIFGAMEAFRNGDPEEAKSSFFKAYHIAEPNHLLMPFAEYGEQIKNLTEYMVKNHEIDPAWARRVTEIAGQYEKNLSAYRE